MIYNNVRTNNDSVSNKVSELLTKKPLKETIAIAASVIVFGFFGFLSITNGNLFLEEITLIGVIYTLILCVKRKNKINTYKK